MVSERGIRISHIVLFSLILLASIVALALSGALVGEYNKGGYPVVHTDAYKDRIRILLVASVWTTLFSLVLGVGFHLLGRHVFFGILTHLVPMTIGFILFLIGVASLTALTDKVDCGKSGQTFSHCSVVKGLVVISWIDTIFIFLSMIYLCVLAFMAHAGWGVHKSTLYVE